MPIQDHLSAAAEPQIPLHNCQWHEQRDLDRELLAELTEEPEPLPPPPLSCHAFLREALRHIRERHAAYTGSWTPLVSSPAYREAERAVDAAVLADDLPATKRACRTLWALAIQYVKKGT